MKLRNFIALIIIVTAFTGCKDDKKPVDSLDAIKPKTESKVQIILNMIVPEDDTFQIYYTQDGTANLKPDQMITVPVKGKDATQDIIFNVPDDVVMTYLRIDVGENSKQGKMTMNSFTYKYYDKKFETKGNVFFQYFNPTEQIAVDLPTSTITPTGKGTMYDPIFYPYLEKLSPEMEKVVKQ